MNTLQNNFGDCTMFTGVVTYLKRGLWRGVAALLCCNTALALDINQANEAELDSLNGMGPALSAKVLKARGQSPFKDWSDLMQRVSGIRHNKAQQLSAQGLTVNGQPLDATR